MARRRFQAPKPKKHGEWWTIRVREDEFVDGQLVRRNKRVRLGSVERMSFREAVKAATEHLRPMNQGLQPVGSAMTFAEFVKQIYLPVTLKGDYSNTTVDRYRGVLEKYLLPQFGHMSIRSLTPLTLQKYFSSAPDNPHLRKLSHESLDKIRDVMASSLRAAQGFNLVVTNAAADISLPQQRSGRRKVKPYLTPEQFSLLLSMMVEPYATMVHAAIYTGLRVSELIALKWDDIHLSSITIDERYCRGDLRIPKSECSNATIAVNRCVIERLEKLKTMTVKVRAGRAVRQYRLVKHSEPSDFVFQSVRTGVPMRDNNILSRHIKPIARKLGMEWVNWRCMRRSHSTWLRMAGADIKDRQAQMRHANASTTLDIYEQFVPESQVRAVERLSKLTETIQ